MISVQCDAYLFSCMYPSPAMEACALACLPNTYVYGHTTPRGRCRQVVM